MVMSDSRRLKAAKSAGGYAIWSAITMNPDAAAKITIVSLVNRGDRASPSVNVAVPTSFTAARRS
jgi:hypothetical protein